MQVAGLEGRDRRTGPTGSGGHSGLQLTGSGNEWAALSLINEECTLSYEETCVKSTPTRWPQRIPSPLLAEDGPFLTRDGDKNKVSDSASPLGVPLRVPLRMDWG